MQAGQRTKGWWTPLIFTLAAISQSIYLFGSHDKIFSELTYALVWIGAFTTWSEYLNVSQHLKKKGLKSARSLPGKFLPNGEDRSD
jgi:hypothetical protein